MTVAEITIAEKLGRFIKADDQYCLELLRFFGGYPRTRFNRLAVIHALNVNGGRLYIERALRQLVDKGMIRISMDNNVPIYSLTEDEPLRSLAAELAKLDWPQWQLLLRQTFSTPVE